METVVCKSVSVFAHALTRGKTYTILAIDHEKRQIKIKGNQDRVRWYPFYCFAMDAEALIKVKAIHLDDPIRDPGCDTVEVTLTVKRAGEESKRWCYFLTPAYAQKMLDKSPSEPLMLGSHGILIPKISEAYIQSAVEYLEQHNEIDRCTLSLGK